MSHHQPCLLQEISEIIKSFNCKYVVDCTAGEGGHTREVSQLVGESGKVIAIEYDPEYYQHLVKNTEQLKNVVTLNRSYAEIEDIWREMNFNKPDAILFDFGISSFHLEVSGRGFSYRRNEVLDMRFNQKIGKPLFQVLPQLTEREIDNILKSLAETPFHRKLSKSIYENRKNIKTTGDLNEIIKMCIPAKYLNNELPRIYQAFRIYVNNELKNVLEGLKLALVLLDKGGVLITISYHSLEDRICKKLKQIRGLKPITKKPITSPDEDLRINPRCRSAKLRAFIKEGLYEEDINRWFNTFSSIFPTNLYGA
jgi:16S rRNA (cytosine1402-N4)-methyltransferase